MNAPVVETQHTELSSAVSQTRRKPLMPLNASQWEIELRTAQLDKKYPRYPNTYDTALTLAFYNYNAHTLLINNPPRR